MENLEYQTTHEQTPPGQTFKAPSKPWGIQMTGGGWTSPTELEESVQMLLQNQIAQTDITIETVDNSSQLIVTCAGQQYSFTNRQDAEEFIGRLDEIRARMKTSSAAKPKPAAKPTVNPFQAWQHP
jgi:hypothetical protein